MRKVLHATLLLALAVAVSGLMTQGCARQESPPPPTTMPSPNPPGPPSVVDALILVDEECAVAGVTPDPVKAHTGNKIRWGTSSECADELDVTIELANGGEGPLEACEKTTKKKRYRGARGILCNVKSNDFFGLAEGQTATFKYTVKAGKSVLDPDIEIWP